MAGKKKPKNSNHLYLVAKLLLIMAGLLLVFIITMAFAILSTHPKFKPNKLSSDQITLQSRIINRILPDIMRSATNDFSQIELSEEEVNSILTLLENGRNISDLFSQGKHDTAQIQPTQDYKVSFQNKKFNIDLAVNTKFNNPFGSYIRLKIQGVPEINEKDAWLKVESASAGLVPLPKDITTTIIRMLLDDLKNEEYYQIARKIIVKVNITPEGKLLITYRPDEVRSLLLKNIFK